MEAPPATNRIPPAGSIDLNTLKPLTSVGLLGAPVSGVLPTWYGGAVTYDKAGHTRLATTPTMGAFEYIVP